MPHQSLLITHTGIIQALFLRFVLLLKDGRSWVKWVGRVRRASPAPSMWVYIHSRTLEGWKMYAVVIMRNYIFPLMHESMKEEEDLTLKVASWILNMHGMNTCSFFSSHKQLLLVDKTRSQHLISCHSNWLPGFAGPWWKETEIRKKDEGSERQG